MAWETGEADLCMKGVSTLRLGAEYKPIPAFSLRAGYNYSTAAYKKDAIKALPSNSINTDTDFANSKSMNTFTLGIGYRFLRFMRIWLINSILINLISIRFIMI